MENYYIEQVNNFVKDYFILLDKDSYISKKELDEFYDKYIDIIEIQSKYKNIQNISYESMMTILHYGNQIIDNQNQKYLERKLIEEKDYFDNMFINIDPNIKLDEEQRKAILIDEDYSLIVAGAGSGKTTTIAAKVKYLIEKKNINPNSIILLSFTNCSVGDLSDLINKKLKLNVEILTFHKLGMKFLRDTKEKTPKIIEDNGMFKIIEQYFINYIFKNKNLLNEYRTIFSKYLYIDDNALHYNTYDDYYKNYMKKCYERDKDNLEEIIKQKITGRNIYYKTINGEKVKSHAEVKIANFLYLNGIDYEYEKDYKYNIEGNKSYKPDFTIFTPEPIYIEYFGLAKINDNIIESEKNQYKKDILQKRKTHYKNNTTLIELYSSTDDNIDYLEILKSELNKRNIKSNKRTKEEIYNTLLETAKTWPYTKLINLFIQFIKIYKETGNNIKDFNYYINNCEDEKVKRQLLLLKEIFIYYENAKSNNNQIDFQDMINNAYNNIEKYKQTKNIDYKYVIIDEYQDISKQRNNFTKRISQIFNSKIVAVGDDWQTIYSFSGSDIELFINFSENMGYCEKVKITNTYRNSQELINIAGEFICKNKDQIKKELHSIKHLDKPVQICEYEYDESDIECKEYVDKLEKLIIDIYNKYPKDKILLLARYNKELDILLKSKKFYKNKLYDNKILLKEYPDINIDILTVHKSKGLGYDRVIILNGLNKVDGFPSKIKDEPIIKYLKTIQNDNYIETIEDPEERRLFYVALTRTKNELYIMTPNTDKYKSEFIKEIEHNENVEVYNA